MLKLPTPVAGIEVDSETRCAHYHSTLDVIAIRLKCCDHYYACMECHIALADHLIVPWPQNEWDQKAVLCGICKTELSVRQYLASNNECPACNAHFNPGCSRHYHHYFEMTKPPEQK